MLNFAFYNLMYYHEKLSYHDKDIMIINTVVKSLSHTITTVQPMTTSGKTCFIAKTTHFTNPMY